MLRRSNVIQEVKNEFISISINLLSCLENGSPQKPRGSVEKGFENIWEIFQENIRKNSGPKCYDKIKVRGLNG